MKKSNNTIQLKPVEINDLYSYKFLSSLVLSPDASTCAFIVSKAIKDGNNYGSDIYVYKDKKALQLTADSKAGFFIFDSNDEILFATNRDKEDKKRSEKQDEFTSFYRISLNGGEAKKAFMVPFNASSIKKISDGLYLLRAEISLDAPEFYKMNDKDKEKVLDERKKNRDYEVMDESPYYANGAGFINKKRNVLFLYDSKSNKTTLITDYHDNVGGYDFTDQYIYYTSSKVKETPVLFSEVDCYDLKTKKKTQLLKPSYMIMDLNCFNNQVLLAMTDGKEFGINENPKFYVLDPLTKKLSLLADNDEEIPGFISSDVHYGATRFTKVDQGYYYYLTPIRNRLVLHRLTKEGKTEAVIDKEGAINDFDIVNGRLVYSADYDMKLNEIYEGKERLTSFNDEALASKYVAKPNIFSYKSQGYDLDGFVLLPMNYNPKKKYPSVLDIHGGPKAIYGQVFMQEMQVWASKGYFVFFTNPYGGSGRGNAFSDLRDKYGTIDYQNLMDFTDEVIKRYPSIDKKKINVTGGSYGGFMTNWIITHTTRFNSAATQRSISNWVTMLGLSDIGINDIVSSYEVGKVNKSYFTDEGIKNLWRMSPLKTVDSVTTPTLFIHSDCDYRCPMAEGLQLFTALLYKNVETRFVLFHGENHELSRSGKPEHRIRRLTEITAWFDKHSK